MKAPLPLTFWQRFKVRAQLFGVALFFLMVLGTIDALYGLIKYASSRWGWLQRLKWLPLDKIKQRLAQARALLYNYLGDIKLYQDPTPKDSAGQELPRVAIQRRMAEGLKIMAGDARIEGYFIVAHSLGSVVAFNGLMEIEDRERLLAKCQGLVTFGSPLNKVAAIWPGLVPINNATLPHPIPWINVADVQDIVAGKTTMYPLDATGEDVGGLAAGLPGGQRDFEWGDQWSFLSAHKCYWEARLEGKSRVIDRLIPWLEGREFTPPEHNISPAIGKWVFAASLVGASAILMGFFSSVVWLLWKLASPSWLPALPGGFLADVCYIATVLLVLGAGIVLAASGLLWVYQTYRARGGGN